MRIARGLALLALPAAALAGSGMQPGLYEYSIRMEMPGLPVAMPPQTFQRCLTQQDLDKGDYARNPREQSDCQISNMKATPANVSYDVACKGEHAARGHYDFAMTRDSMTGTGTITMEGGQTMKQNFSARRLGDCK